MKCPECGTDFKGGRFWLSGVRGPMRECPYGHQFHEPPKPRKEHPAVERAARAYMRLQCADVPRGPWHWEVSEILRHTETTKAPFGALEVPHGET
jgi:hypothetical protein